MTARPVGGGFERARDDRPGPVASHRVDRDPGHGPELYGASMRSGSTSRPLYVPQFAHT